MPRYHFGKYRSGMRKQIELWNWKTPKVSVQDPRSPSLALPTVDSCDCGISVDSSNTETTDCECHMHTSGPSHYKLHDTTNETACRNAQNILFDKN